MKLKDPKLTMLIDEKGARIEVTDGPSGIEFLRLSLTPEQLASAMGRIICVKCVANVYGLDKVGLQHENKTLEFGLPDSAIYDTQKGMACIAAAEACPDGWTPDTYYGSQNSFFTKGEEKWARVTIRRWVPRGDE